MGKLRLKKKRLVLAGGGLLTFFVMTMPALAASWRVDSYVSGYSELNSQTILSDSSGNEIYNFSGYQWLDSDYQRTYTANEAVSFDRAFRQGGQPVDSPYTADWAAYAETGYGKNKVSTSMSGTLTSLTYEEIIENPVTGNTMFLSVNESKYVYGASTWEELFLITPKNKALLGTEASIKMYVNLDGSLTGDSSYFSYNLSNFDRTSVASDYASGNTTVDDKLIGTFTFIYGEPLYLQSSLYAQVSNGIGSVDMAHTAEVTGIELPEGSKIKFLSGADATAYGTLQGGDGYGEYGTGTGAVPVPSALLLLSSALLGLVGLNRRK